MRKIVFILPVPVLTACLFAVDGPPSPRPTAGVYRGDHGAISRSRGLESELILNEDGAFRYFLIDSNTAFLTAKGRWSVGGDQMEWKGVSRSRLYHGGFRAWDTAALPDTSYLRKVDDSGFERLELTYDSLFSPVIQWVGYRRISPESILADGTFEFSEAYPDGADTTLTIHARTRLEIVRNGPYMQKIFRNGDLAMDDVDSIWTQVGTHLITTRNRHCGYEPDYVSCSDAPPDYEYVARLADVGDKEFSLWIAPDFSYQPGPYWAVFRRVQ